MTIKDVLSTSYIALSKLTKNKLLKALQSLREKYIELEKKINEVEAENAKLKEEVKSLKIKSVNKDANRPSSKQPEWEEKGVGNDGKGKKKGRGRGKAPRKGAGNRAKKKKPNRAEKATVEECCLCGKDLSEEQPLESTNDRIIEDIPDTVEKLEIISVNQEKKYCNDCKEVITAKSDLALPKSDIGLNATEVSMPEEKRRILILNYDSEATKRVRDIFSQHCDVTTGDSLKDVAEKADEDFDIIISGYVIPSVSGGKPVSYLQNIQKALEEAKLAVQEKRGGNEALLGESQKKWDEILKLLNDRILVIENERAELKQEIQSLVEETNTARKQQEEAEKKAEATLKDREEAEEKAEATLKDREEAEEKAEAAVKDKEDAEKETEAALMEKAKTEEELAEFREEHAKVIAKLNDEVNTLTKELENSISLAEEAHKEKASIEKELVKLQENWEKYVAGQ